MRTLGFFLILMAACSGGPQPHDRDPFDLDLLDQDADVVRLEDGAIAPQLDAAGPLPQAGSDASVDSGFAGTLADGSIEEDSAIAADARVPDAAQNTVEQRMLFVGSWDGLRRAAPCDTIATPETDFSCPGSVCVGDDVTFSVDEVADPALWALREQTLTAATAYWDEEMFVFEQSTANLMQEKRYALFDAHTLFGSESLFRVASSEQECWVFKGTRVTP